MKRKQTGEHVVETEKTPSRIRRLGKLLLGSTELENSSHASFYIGRKGSTSAFEGREEISDGKPLHIDQVIPPIGDIRVFSRTIERNALEGTSEGISVLIDPVHSTEDGDAVSTGLCHIVRYGVRRASDGRHERYVEYERAAPFAEQFHFDDDLTLDLPKEVRIGTLSSVDIEEGRETAQVANTPERQRTAEHYADIMGCVAAGRAKS